MIDDSMLFHCLHMLHTYVNCHSADAAVFLVMPLLIVKRLLSEITQRDGIGSALHLPKKKKLGTLSRMSYYLVIMRKYPVIMRSGSHFKALDAAQ